MKKALKFARNALFLGSERTRNNLSNIRYWLQRERSNIKDAPTIEKEAFLQLQEMHRKLGIE
jgi:hypothetical protein